MIQGIRHIIFDLGGVILNLDYTRTETAFLNAGVRNFSALFSQLKQTSLFDDLETGKCDRTTFLQRLKQEASADMEDEKIIAAWNAMLLDFPLIRLQLLQQLRGHYDLFLLSNTNEIHESAFNGILMGMHGYENIGLFFDKTYYSHRLGLRKPMPEIFHRVLQENGLQAGHTLFIDDSLPNVEAARSAGIRCIHLEKGMTIEKDIFRTLIPA